MRVEDRESRLIYFRKVIKGNLKKNIIIIIIIYIVLVLGKWKVERMESFSKFTVNLKLGDAMIYIKKI
jgi:hypothetical protein